MAMVWLKLIALAHAIAAIQGFALYRHEITPMGSFSSAMRVGHIRNRPSSLCMHAREPRDSKITKRAFISSLFHGALFQLAPAFADGPTAAEDEGQIVDVDQINGKKLAVLLGALFVADLLSGALTGRSVLRIVGSDKTGIPAWQQKVLDELLEKEKKEAAARMGVTATTTTKPRGPSATGDYAATDPLEIAKQRYKKKESIEDLQRDLRNKLDGQRTLGFDKEEDE